MPTQMSQIKTIKSLPKISATWYLAIRQLHTWLELDDGSTAHPYILILINLDQENIISIEILPSSPKDDQILRFIYNAILNPGGQSTLQPCRPDIILCDELAVTTVLKTKLKSIEINIKHQHTLPQLVKIINEIEDLLGGHEPTLPGLLDIPGVTPNSLESLFSAAADFYRESPWNALSDAQPLRAYFHDIQKEAYIQLMGYAGLEYGIILYWSWDDLIHTFVSADDPIEQVPPGGWRSLTFENADMMPWEDLNAIKDHGWEIAGETAYPLIMIYTRTSVVRPTKEELLIFEVLLRSIPSFVNGYLHADSDGDYYPVQSLHQVQIHNQSVSITLSYPAGELPVDLLGDTEMDDPSVEGSHYNLGEGLSYTQRLIEFKDINEYHSKDISSEISSPDHSTNRSQHLIQLACQEPEISERIRLANQALSINNNCIDAYVLLAEDQADSIEEAFEYYLTGTMIGEQTIGIHDTENYDPLIRKHPEFTPYLRARSGLAECLVLQSKFKEAQEHCKSILAMNPDDDLGIRYLYLSLLIRTSNDQSAWGLIEEYHEDDSTDWKYSHALLSFRKEGEITTSNKLLLAALQFNPYVPNYLTGRSPLPDEPLSFIRPGDESEAVDYVRDHFANWYGTAGAIDWLKSFIDRNKK